MNIREMTPVISRRIKSTHKLLHQKTDKQHKLHYSGSAEGLAPLPGAWGQSPTAPLNLKQMYLHVRQGCHNDGRRWTDFVL